VIQVDQGSPENGLQALRQTLKTLPEDRDETLTSLFRASLAQALAATGEPEAAEAEIDDAIARVERDGDLSELPELLRVRGDILAAQGRLSSAARAFQRGLDLANAQSACFCELRCALPLTRLHLASGRRAEASLLLAPIVGRFASDDPALDVIAARRLLTEIGAHSPAPRAASSA
jgi:ATP/maltotriose-dependent transcriptional regulator MalT